MLKRIRRRRSRSATPEERPSFATPMAPAQKAAAAAIGFKIPPVPLNRETNKGAQLMAKMGWEGRGLGAKEQVNFLIYLIFKLFFLNFKINFYFINYILIFYF